MKYRVTWQNGDVVLLEGEDIADAFNSVGYTKADITSIDNYYEYAVGDKEDPDYPLADFACPVCMGMLDRATEKSNTNNTLMFDYITHFYKCRECGFETPKAVDEVRACIVMNIYCATRRVPSGGEVDRYYKAINEKH